ncbi:MAG TPA: hypothetical protein VFU02_13545 [Polyangiaceae bacterium]|nr:hypothetical protein [Polyangiaceae bacterium]
MARSRFRWPQTCTLMLLLCAGPLGGCHKIFGDYEIVEEPPPPPPPTTLCVAGDLRCVGPFLYTCGADLESWAYLETCLTDAHCRSREGGCKTCVTGEYRCNEALLEVCDDTASWTLAADCGNAHACNLNSDSCRACTPDERECHEGALLRCSPERTWVLEEQCANPAACSVAADKSTGTCAEVDPRCTTPLMHVCDGPTLLRCTDSRDRLVLVESCASAAHCDAAAADQQAQDQRLATCLEICEPDAIRCVDAEFQRCSADGTWAPMMACSSPAACSAKLGATGCEPCTAGALECNDGQLRRCAPESSSGWDIVADCGVARLCNEAEGRCDPGACPRAGQTRCDDGLERCAPDQSEWDPIDFCEGDLCNANDAKCELGVCEEDARRCWEGNLQQCDESLRSWRTLQECADGETCSLEGCSSNGCTDGEYRCNDVYLQTCVAGAWEREARCETAALCNAADRRCEAPVCEANTADCAGTSLRHCRSDRTGYEEVGDCADYGLVCNEYAGECR